MQNPSTTCTASTAAPVQYLETVAASTELVVVLHGFTTPDDRLKDVRRVVRDAKPKADIYAPRLPYASRLWCTEPAESIAEHILTELDLLVCGREDSQNPYSSVIFIGHSNGAILARRIIVSAFGEQVRLTGSIEAPFEVALKHSLNRESGPRKFPA